MNKNLFIKHTGKCLLLTIVGMLISFQVLAQNLAVKGSVVDKNGEAIIGANILVKGTTNGSITDFDGNFTLEAKKGDILVFSFIGYKNQELPAAANMKIVLHEDTEVLDDVIVIGYATGSQRTVSGAIQRVGREDMNAGVVTNPLQAIKGKVAGVNIQKSGGDPTASASIRVRGTTSLSGGNDPLVIIDGVFGDLSMLNAISPADIESFTVLKDASETAQYGSRGASGVIVVTTIKGKNGTKSLSYDGSFGVETVYKNLSMLDASAYRQVVADRGYANAMDMGYNTNFIEAMQQTGYTQNHRISFGGGTESSNYRASIGVIDQKGIIKDNYMRNYTAKLDASQTMFNNKLKIDFGMFASKVDKRYLNDYQKTFYSAASFNPTFPDFPNEDGTWPEDPSANETQNPLGRLTIKDVESNSYINANARLTWTVIDGLKLSAFGSYTYNVKENSVYIPTNIKAGIGTNGLGSKNDNKSGVLLGNFTANYKKAFGSHFIDVLGLAELQDYRYTGFGAQAKQFGTNFFGFNNLGAGAEVKYGDVSSYSNDYSIASFMGRFNYSYADKYIATVNMRADGSSKLGANNKWGFFPSASLAWVLKEEAFLKNVDFLTNLKLRAGYGLTGNQDAIGAYNSLKLMSPTGVTTINGKPVVTYGINRNENPDLKWETVAKADIGIHAVFFERLTLEVDYYNQRTKDMIFDVPLSYTTGFGSILKNVGEMENKGIEFLINANVLRNKDFSWDVRFTGTANKNKIIKLATEKPIENTLTIRKVGEAYNTFYMPEYAGVDPETGEAMWYKGQEGDEKTKNVNEAGQRIVGSADPKFYGGFSTDFSYKGVTLNAVFNYSCGGKKLSPYYESLITSRGTGIASIDLLDRWTPENTDAKFPRPIYNAPTDTETMYYNTFSASQMDFSVQNASFLRLSTLSLSYTFPKSVSEKMRIGNLRIYSTVSNVFCLTPYKGYDPETGDWYPPTRMFVFGLNVSL